MAILDKLLDFGDDAGVKLIMKASEKKNRVNALLEEAGADVRISAFDVEMGIPPSISFSIESLPPEAESR